MKWYACTYLPLRDNISVLLTHYTTASTPSGKLRVCRRRTCRSASASASASTTVFGRPQACRSSPPWRNFTWWWPEALVFIWASTIRHRVSSSTAADEFSTYPSVVWYGLHQWLCHPFYNRCMTRSLHLSVLASGDPSAYRRRVPLWFRSFAVFRFVDLSVIQLCLKDWFVMWMLNI
jgi:hypothetical protein